MKYELPHIVATQGAIVNIASGAGLVGGRIGAACYASKQGVVGLTKAAAPEYADKGVRINAVAPAVIVTPMAERGGLSGGGDPKLAARVMGMHPMGRLGAPEEVARAVLWLCSKGVSFATGHTLPVDDGFLTHCSVRSGLAPHLEMTPQPRAAPDATRIGQEGDGQAWPIPDLHGPGGSIDEFEVRAVR